MDLDLDPRLAPLLAEALVREGRKAGVSLSDMETMSFDAAIVAAFLESVRANQTRAFMASLDRPRLERARRHGRIDMIAGVARAAITTP